MKKVIIYGSHYGTTRRYAKKLSELTGIVAINYSDVKDLSGYETVIHMGGLYAGGVKGLKNTVKFLADSTRLIVVTVGLADVTKKENTDHIKNPLGCNFRHVYWSVRPYYICVEQWIIANLILRINL